MDSHLSLEKEIYSKFIGNSSSSVFLRPSVDRREENTLTAIVLMLESVCCPHNVGTTAGCLLQALIGVAAFDGPVGPNHESTLPKRRLSCSAKG